MNDHIWTPSGTDITERWRRLGWLPPSENPVYQEKWSSYKELPLRTLSDLERIAFEKMLNSNIIPYPGSRR
ncbi:MAG: hypothetical protein RL156_1770 [Bacteroidota bacterium]|jgi:hypothetical protein